MKNVKTYR